MLRSTLLALILSLPQALAGGTPDGATPAEETVCDDFSGASFGLCNAYCEAMDCDHPDHSASDEACEAVRANFEAKAGVTIPCGGEEPPPA